MRSALGSIIDLGDGRKRVFVDYGTDANGKRVRRSKTVRGSMRDAERVKLEMLSSTVAASSNMTLSQYIDTVYMPAKTKELKETTLSSYRSCIDVWIKPRIGHIRLSKLTPKAVKRWLASMPDDNKRLVACRMLRAILGHALDREDVTANAAEGLVMARSTHEPTVIDAQDIAVYLWHFRDTQPEPYVLLAIGGGFRRGEMCALDVEDINTATGAVTVDDNIVVFRGHIKRQTTKTRNSIRRVYLPPVILARLVETMPESGPICHEADGQRTRPDAMSRRYSSRLESLPDGVPRVPLRDLRHSSLTLAYDAGSDILDVSRRAGHASIRTTERFYVRPSGSRDAAVAEAMSGAIGSRWHA